MDKLIVVGHEALADIRRFVRLWDAMFSIEDEQIRAALKLAKGD